MWGHIICGRATVVVQKSKREKGQGSFCAVNLATAYRKKMKKETNLNLQCALSP